MSSSLIVALCIAGHLTGAATTLALMFRVYGPDYNGWDDGRGEAFTVFCLVAWPLAGPFALFHALARRLQSRERLRRKIIAQEAAELADSQREVERLLASPPPPACYVCSKGLAKFCREHKRLEGPL